MKRGAIRGDTVVACGLLAIALLFGGGSPLFPFYRLLVEVAAVLTLVWFAWRPWQMPEGASAKLAALLLVAVMALMLAQLVPLPPSVWQDLPGRSLVVDVYSSIGNPDRWAPISLNPAATRASIAFFLVPLAIFVATMRLGPEGRHYLLLVLAGFGLLNAVLVVLQFQGLSFLTFYVTGSLPGTGLFANKNHSAVFLVATMPVVAWAIMNFWHGASQVIRRWVGVAAVGFLSLTVFGCLSRAGLALLPIGLFASLMILLPRSLNVRRIAVFSGIFLVVALLLVVVVPQTTVGSRALNRFDATSDLRYGFWPVVAEGIGQYFPVGSGLGTFVPVFAAMEPLSIVAPNFINHAHSDYMEVALETGLAGMVLVACFILWFIITGFVRLRQCWWGKVGFAPITIAITGITALLLHSILDYPLRTLAIASMMSVYCAILATRPSALDLEQPKRYRREAGTHTAAI